MADFITQLPNKLTEAVGGPARRRAVMLLAAVLSLETADAATVGALAAPLEKHFHIGNTQVGLLITVNLLVGAVASVPMGLLADRNRRVRALVFTICLWALAIVVCGLSSSYTMLLISRLGLGVVTASAGPMVASLSGDLFPAAERAQMYGMILTGELLGSGAGLLISADVGDVAGWRVPFFLLAVPSVVLAVCLHRMLPEPARGGQSWLRPGDEEVRGVDEIEEVIEKAQELMPNGTPPAASELQIEAPGEASEVRRRARQRSDVKPRPNLVLRQDPAKMSSWAAASYILRIPSNRVLIGASVLGYFFLSGVRAFAVLFAQSHFQVSTGVVTLIFLPIGAGAVVGTMLGGRLTDRLVHKGRTDARVVVSGGAFVAAALLFVPGLLSGAIWLSLPFLIVAAMAIAVPNPGLDAARLDVVPSRLWGRGEGVRTFAQSVLQALAPLAFGYISSLLGGPRANLGSGVNTGSSAVPQSAATGLGSTFLIMLVPLFAAGFLLLWNRMAYLRDVATADLSEAPRGIPTTESPMAAGDAPSSGPT